MKITFQAVYQPTPPRKVFIELTPEEGELLKKLVGHITGGGDTHSPNTITPLNITTGSIIGEKAVQIRKLTDDLYHALDAD